MTQEEKELVLKDLCARLPYVTYYDLSYYGHKTRAVVQEFSPSTDLLQSLVKVNTVVGFIPYENIKPYLRPLSSMTEEERKKLFSLCAFAEYTDWEGQVTELYVIEIAHRYDPTHNSDKSFKIWGVDMRAIHWLNEHHFDYLQLIESGLALEAPEEMYK